MAQLTNDQPATLAQHGPTVSQPPPTSRPVSPRTLIEALYRAVAAARYAPSAHNDQPWRWRLSGNGLDLFVEPGRMPGVTEPDRRIATLGCGAALHHARLALAAHGWRVNVSRLPDATDHGHLARLHIDTTARTGPATARRARYIRLRHTDPRPVTGEPLRPGELSTLRTAFESQHVLLHILRPDEILELTVATGQAGNAAPAEAQWHDELALWAGGGRIVGAGDHRRRPATHGVHDRAATYAVLHSPGDRELDWLRAGEALSAGWLVATVLKVSVLPFSAPIETAEACETLRRALPDLGQPHLIMRLGRHTTGTTAPLTPRLATDQIIERPAGLPERGHQRPSSVVG